MDPIQRPYGCSYHTPAAKHRYSLVGPGTAIKNKEYKEEERRLSNKIVLINHILFSLSIGDFGNW